MKKLLFINGHLNVGGVERSLVDLLCSLDYGKYSVDLLLFEGLGDYVDELPKEVNVIYKDLTSAFGPLPKALVRSLFTGNIFAFLYRLSELFKNDKLLKKALSFLPEYDAAVAYRTGFCHRVLSLVCAKRKLAWWHHGEVNLSTVQREQFLSYMKSTDKLVCVSDSIRSEVCKSFPLLEDKLTTIPNMINSQALQIKLKQPHDSRRRDGAVNLLSIGRFSPEKNYTVCPDVCKALTEAGYTVNWIMVGDGVQRNDVAERAKSLGVYDSFNFVGTAANPYVYASDCDVFVHPSVVESQSITILEAMACGLPVVAVESLGPSEFITDAENGFLCKNSVAQLADRILKVFADIEIKKRFVNGGFATVKEFSPKNTVRKFEELVVDL